MPSHTACLNRTEFHFPLSMWLTTADQTYVGSKIQISCQTSVRLRDQDGALKSIHQEHDRKRKLEYSVFRNCTFWRWDKLIDVLRAFFSIFNKIVIQRFGFYLHLGLSGRWAGSELLPQLASHWLVIAACPAHLVGNSPPLVCAIVFAALYAF